VAAAAAVAWLAGLVALGARRIVVSLDSLSNYAHVWWIGESLRAGHGLPWRMPVLGHGDALTYPYAFVPWTAAGLAWPVGDEHVVSITLALGALALVLATFYAFPEVSEGWWAAATLANPILLMAPLAGQLPFEWAAAALLAAIGSWRRGHRVAAAVLAALAMLTHAAVLVPLTALVVAAWLPREHDRRGLLTAWAAATLAALPAVAVVVASPVATDSSTATQIAALAETLAARAFVVIVPAAFTVLRRSGRSSLGPALFGAALVMNVALYSPLQLDQAWRSLVRRPDPTVAAFARTGAFTTAATYRLLRAGDAKVGMYQLLRAGARLDSEFFPESMARRSFPDTASYVRFLLGRRVDEVMVFDSYDRAFGTNEHRLLAVLAASSACVEGRRVDRRATGPGFVVYAVTATGC